MTTTIEGIRRLRGFRVADATGQAVGVVECPMYGTDAERPDALAVRSGSLLRRRFIVPLAAVAGVDDRSKVVALATARQSLQRFF